MKRIAFIGCVVLVLSGCSLTSTYTIDSDGGISGTTSFGVPKSAVRNVTTLEQWSQVLKDNDLSTPTPSPVVSTSGLPAPAVSCGPGEDLANSEWTYSCSVSGDLSALSYANFSELSGQSAFGGLEISRVGTTVTITQPATSTTGDSGSGLDFGLKGISLFYTNSTLTFPGTVGEVTGGAIKVDDHTVSFPTNGNQSAAMSATVDVPTLVSAPTSLTLTTVATAGFPDGANVALTAKLGTPADGQVEFFDGQTSLGMQTIGADGTSVFEAQELSNGQHAFRAVFSPKDWWSLESSEASKALTVSSFTKSGMPIVLGSGRVGAKLSVGSLKTTPQATSVTFQWLRNGKSIAGSTGSTYKVVSVDYHKTISVRVTFRKAGYLTLALTSPSQVRITKR
jgi:hypothetical protein